MPSVVQSESELEVNRAATGGAALSARELGIAGQLELAASSLDGLQRGDALFEAGRWAVVGFSRGDCSDDEFGGATVVATPAGFVIIPDKNGAAFNSPRDINSDGRLDLLLTVEYVCGDGSVHVLAFADQPGGPEVLPLPVTCDHAKQIEWADEMSGTILLRCDVGYSVGMHMMQTGEAIPAAQNYALAWDGSKLAIRKQWTDSEQR